MAGWAGVVLAAGQGARMKSKLPKPLHRICGKELARYPVELVRRAGIERVVIVVSPSTCGGIRGLFGSSVEYVMQPQASGTGDAVSCAQSALEGQVDHLLVLNCDSPLVSDGSVSRLIASHLEGRAAVGMLTARVPVSQDLGIVLQDEDGRVMEVREAADDNRDPSAPAEVNGGVYCFDTRWLWSNLPRIHRSPGGERYLTSLISLASGDEETVIAEPSLDPADILGINNRVQLAHAEAVMRQRIREQWMLAGVTIQDPGSVHIDSGVTIGQDTVILPNTMLLGETWIGGDCEIGPNSVVRDSTVGQRCRVAASVLEESTMEAGSDIGPFSHLRPGAHLESGVHIGNFAEIKASRLASGTLMGHFGYVGDASVGPGVNIGAGVVTCNFDGRDKHRTDVGSGAFIGCDTMLVAPVSVGDGAYTGAGAVVTRDVPPGRLAVGVPAKMREKPSESD